MVHLIGGYKDALKLRQGEKITFHEEAFLASRPPHMTPFLQVNNFRKSQLFFPIWILNFSHGLKLRNLQHSVSKIVLSLFFSKGQLISEWIFLGLKFSQIATENLKDFCPDSKKWSNQQNKDTFL